MTATYARPGRSTERAADRRGDGRRRADATGSGHTLGDRARRRGLNIISSLAQDWGVRDGSAGEVTVWVIVTEGRHHDDFATRVDVSDLGFADAFDPADD